MKISKEEMRSRLWAEWVNGLKIVADSLAKDSLQITNSPCTMVLGNENFIQKSVMYVQRKSYIGGSCKTMRAAQFDRLATSELRRAHGFVSKVGVRGLLWMR